MKSFAVASFYALFNAVLVLSAPSAPDSTAGALLSERATSLWTPAVGTTWNYLIGIDVITVDQAIASKAKVVDIDLFRTPAATIAAIQAKNVSVICYFSAGTHEPNRPDNGNFTTAEIGAVVDGWPEENWLDIRTANVKAVMTARVQLASDKGCNGVEPDNVDGYDNTNGLGLTKQNSIDLMTLLATKAASLNVAIGLKNSAGLISSLISKVQYAVNEECVEWEECDDWKPFITAKKPVFHVEYPATAVPGVTAKNVPQYCVTSFSTILKIDTLLTPTQYCPDGSQVVTTSTTG